MKFLEGQHEDDVSIAEMLHTVLKIVEPTRPLGNIHASSLTSPKKYCPREIALCKHLGRPQFPNHVDAPMHITFHEGKDKQARFNNYWLRDRMVGDWKCNRCGTTQQFCKIPGKCSCGGSASTFVYQEVIFYHHSGAQGSLDAIVDVGKTKLRLVEFKIMSTKEWEELKAPLAEHRVRSKLYLELIAGSNHPGRDSIDTNRIHVLYCMRGYGRMHPEKKLITPFKEFIVHRDPTEVQVYLDMATAVQKSKNSEWELFPEGICSSLFDKRCNSCSVQKECFSGKFPATIKWKPTGSP